MPPLPGGEKIAFVCAMTTNALKPPCSTRLTLPVKPSIFEWSQEIGKHDRRVEEHAEVVGVVRALVEVAEVGDDPAAECLLDAELALIALARLEDLALAEHAVQSDAARQQQVLVVRRLQRPAVRRAQHRTAAGNRVRHAETRLHQRLGRQAVVVIEPHAELEAGIAGLDVVLDVGRLLLDRRRLGVERAATRRASDRTGSQIRVEVRTVRRR